MSVLDEPGPAADGHDNDVILGDNGNIYRITGTAGFNYDNAYDQQIVVRAAKVTLGFRYPQLSTWFYLVMGWMGLVAFGPLREQLGTQGLVERFAHRIEVNEGHAQFFRGFARGVGIVPQR